MKKPLISHECPKCLLEINLSLSDYQYCLPHLMEQDKEYRDFFLKCKEDNIEIYLDNSIHELGKSMDDEILLKWLTILKPSTFFVPDVWENTSDTIENARRWIKYKDTFKETTLTAVVQAKSLVEATECYREFKEMGYEKIAFSYGASYYHEWFLHPNINVGKALGRLNVISILKSLGTIEYTDRIHLLGSANVSEFVYYKNMPFIESIDTSNPIMAAIDGVYYSDYMHDKPIANMNNSFNIDIEEIDMYAVYNNVEMFRKLIK